MNRASLSENFELQSMEICLPIQRIAMSEACGGEMRLSQKISLTSICHNHKNS